MSSSKMIVIIEKLNSDDDRTALTPASPCSLRDKRIGDLVLDFARTAAHPIGEDDDLVLAQVGDGIDRRVQHGVDARTRVSAAARISTRKRLRIESSMIFSIMATFPERVIDRIAGFHLQFALRPCRLALRPSRTFGLATSNSITIAFMKPGMS